MYCFSSQLGQWWLGKYSAWLEDFDFGGENNRGDAMNMTSEQHDLVDRITSYYHVPAAVAIAVLHFQFGASVFYANLIDIFCTSLSR